jgi:hypothetical protein
MTIIIIITEKIKAENPNMNMKLYRIILLNDRGFLHLQ